MGAAELAGFGKLTAREISQLEHALVERGGSIPNRATWVVVLQEMSEEAYAAPHFEATPELSVI